MNDSTLIQPLYKKSLYDNTYTSWKTTLSQLHQNIELCTEICTVTTLLPEHVVKEIAPLNSPINVLLVIIFKKEAGSMISCWIALCTNIVGNYY